MLADACYLASAGAWKQIPFRGFTMGFRIQKVGLKRFKLDSDIQEIKDVLKLTWTGKKKPESTNLNKSRIRDLI